MNSTYVSLIAGFVGVLIGALSSIITTFVQSRSQDKRERLKLVKELALEDYKISFEIFQKRGGTIPPIAIYLHYHSELMDLVDSGRLNNESYRKIYEENQKLIATVSDLSTRDVAGGGESERPRDRTGEQRSTRSEV